MAAKVKKVTARKDYPAFGIRKGEDEVRAEKLQEAIP